MKRENGEGIGRGTWNMEEGRLIIILVDLTHAREKERERMGGRERRDGEKKKKQNAAEQAADSVNICPDE